MHLILIVAALVVFILASLPRVNIGGVNLVPLGLALLTASFLI